MIEKTLKRLTEALNEAEDAEFEKELQTAREEDIKAGRTVKDESKK